jgi:hypothetical protein
MDIDQGSQDVKVFMELNQLNEDEAEAFNSTSLDEWQDQCVRLAKGIKEWANHLELRIASIEYRLDRLEDRHGHQTVDSQT